jgi:hypothetical protein
VESCSGYASRIRRVPPVSKGVSVTVREEG